MFPSTRSLPSSDASPGAENTLFGRREKRYTRGAVASMTKFTASVKSDSAGSGINPIGPQISVSRADGAIGDEKRSATHCKRIDAAGTCTALPNGSMMSWATNNSSSSKAVPRIGQSNRPTVGLDGGYVLASDQKSRTEGWIEVIAGKSVWTDGGAKVFAFVNTYDTKPSAGFTRC
jgi:hypothetical protein